MTPLRASFYGYRIVAACGVIQAINLGGIFTFGVLFPELENEFGWSRTAISGATSFAFLMVGTCTILMGRATDWLGPRIVLTVAGALLGLGYGLFYRMEAVWELYLYYGLLVGVGLAAHDVCTLSTIARWFERRRGLMTGLVKAGGGAGQVVVPLVAAALIAGVGWRLTCLLFGLAAAIVLVAAAQAMRRNPAELGLKPDGVVEDKVSDAVQEEEGVSLKEAAKTRILWVLCIAKFCDLFCLFTVIIHIIPYSMDHGTEPAVAAGLLSTIGAMSIVGRIVLGGAFDRIGPRWSLLGCFAILTASLVMLQFAESTWSLFIFAIVYGPAHGGFFTITSPSMAEYFGTRSHGTLFGLVVCCGTVGSTLGPLVAGGLFDALGSYKGAFALLLGFSMLGLFMASALPSHRRFEAHRG